MKRAALATTGGAEDAGLMDQGRLADFLRTRREALTPHDVGLPAGKRRRTAGLRREEVAALAMISTDYYCRMEQQRGPQPSMEVLASLARALRLSLDERERVRAARRVAVRATLTDISSALPAT